MSKTTKYSSQDERQLMMDLWSPDIRLNPYNFVMFAFPWGERDTPLEKYPGPRTWQEEDLKEIAEHIRQNGLRVGLGMALEMMQKATVSGRGSGKSALVAWLVLWMMSCHIGSTTIVTANTEQQLKTRTWAELGKWHAMSINEHWFEKQALSLKPAEWFEKGLKEDLKIDTGYYYAQAQLWSEEKPDAFAGAHNPHGILVIYDEASGIPKPIWTVTEGFFTEPEEFRFWLVYSNGRRNTGEFFECFQAHRSSWRRRHLDSRTVEGTDQAIYQRIIDKYGVDSDEARVEVYGQFPQQGDNQFISRAQIQEAAERELLPDMKAPLIMGVDVARFGNDKSVIRWRQGRDGRSIPPREYKGLDNMELAYEVAHWIDKTDPDAVCIDAGNGTGVIDRLKDLGYKKIHEIWFGSKSSDPEWANNRTHIWAKMREWLRGGMIDVHGDLMSDLAGPEYKFQGSSDKIRLETKEEMKSRGLASPDHGDALACTFAVEPARRDRKIGASRGGRVVRGVDYDIFG